MTIEGTVPETAAGLQLYRIVKENPIACEPVMFVKGWTAVDTILRRASISGRVEISGEISNHFADILDASGDIVETVSLDRKSYGSLKNHWMRCKVQQGE